MKHLEEKAARQKDILALNDSIIENLDNLYYDKTRIVKRKDFEDLITQVVKLSLLTRSVVREDLIQTEAELEVLKNQQ